MTVSLTDRRAMFTADEQLLADLLRRDRSTPPDRLWRYVWDVLGRDQLPHLPAHLQLDHAAKRLIALGRLIDDLEASDVQDYQR